MATLQQAIKNGQDLIYAIGGIKKAPEFPPQTINQFPFSVAHEGPGVWEMLPGEQKRGLQSIVFEIHNIRGKNLTKEIEKIHVYSDLIPNALIKGLYKDRWGGTISTFAQISTSGIAQLDWQGDPTVGIRFIVENIKIISAVV